MVFILIVITIKKRIVFEIPYYSEKNLKVSLRGKTNLLGIK